MNLLLSALILLISLAGPVQACRLALALALDVSGSVDQDEYQLQMHGLAEALSDPDVTAAILAPPAPVALAIYEWSSSDYQRLVQDWVMITDKSVLRDVVVGLRNWQRQLAPEATGIGAALAYGKEQINRGPDCWAGTLDISGDGKNNDWPTPRELKLSGKLHGITINALVITRDGHGILPPEPGELPAYFEALVIHGPGAFVEVARGFEDYANAMRRKLLKELATRPLGWVSPMPGRLVLNH